MPLWRVRLCVYLTTAHAIIMRIMRVWNLCWIPTDFADINPAVCLFIIHLQSWSTYMCIHHDEANYSSSPDDGGKWVYFIDIYIHFCKSISRGSNPVCGPWVLFDLARWERRSIYAGRNFTNHRSFWGSSNWSISWWCSWKFYNCRRHAEWLNSCYFWTGEWSSLVHLPIQMIVYLEKEKLFNTKGINYQSVANEVKWMNFWRYG